MDDFFSVRIFLLLLFVHVSFFLCVSSEEDGEEKREM
jgi:hypothetical protein